MNRRVHVSVVVGESLSHLVHWVDESSHVSSTNQVKVRAVFTEYFSLEDSLGAPALVTIEDSVATRRIRGTISEIGVVATPYGPDTVAPVYEFTISSHLARLAGSVDSQIFQELTTQEIVGLVLEEHGLGGLEADWQLSQTLDKRTYCTQYSESGLNFISRLLEEEGIYFFATTDKDGNEILHFADASPQAPRSPEKTLTLRNKGGGDGAETAVYRLDLGNAIHSGKFTTKSFNFEKPQLPLECSVKGDLFDDLETYIPSELFTTDSRGAMLAQNRLEHSVAGAEYGELETNDLLVQPGMLLSIQENGKKAQQFFVTTTLLRYAQTSKDAGASGTHEFTLVAAVIPAEIPYRPPLRHPKPRIWGPQTAIVVGEQGADTETVLTEEYGRIKVQFHWDRRAKLDSNASPWIRVAQLQTSGAIHFPRIHWEVVVEFLEGNPDQPIVTGRLFNGSFMPPYVLPKGKTRTSLQSASSPAGGGRNEIRFEDAAGQEELMVASQYNTVINASNDRKKNVTANETLVVGNSSTTTVGGNQDLKTTKGLEVSVGADQTIDVGGSRNREVNAVSALKVGGSSSTQIGGNWMSMVGNPLDALIALGTAEVAKLATAKADQAMKKFEGAAQGAIDQALGPIKGLTDQVDKIQASMQELASGKQAAAAAVMGGAIALPSAMGMMSALASGPAATNTADGAESSAGQVAVASMVSAAVTGKLTQATRAAKTAALGDASASSGQGGGGKSQENQSGPDGALEGFEESDTTTGPGHSQHLLSSTHKETIGALRLCAAVASVNYNIAGNMSENVGAAHIELIKGNRAEAWEAASETESGLIVMTSGDEIETVKASSQLSLGGALMETVKGDYCIEASTAITLVGALQDWTAKSKITFKCGASTLVIDGSGVTLESPMVSISGSTVKATKAVHDG